MFTLTKEFRFEAAHRLPRHDGKCARLHGHSWKMRVVVQGENLQPSGPKVGMLQDYADISKVVNPLIESALDHHYLNETLGISDPTSEHVALWAFNTLKPILPGLVAIEVDETCTCSCRYEPTVQGWEPSPKNKSVKKFTFQV